MAASSQEKAGPLHLCLRMGETAADCGDGLHQEKPSDHSSSEDESHNYSVFAEPPGRDLLLAELGDDGVLCDSLSVSSQPASTCDRVADSSNDPASLSQGLELSCNPLAQPWQGNSAISACASRGSEWGLGSVETLLKEKQRRLVALGLFSPRQHVAGQHGGSVSGSNFPPHQECDDRTPFNLLPLQLQDTPRKPAKRPFDAAESAEPRAGEILSREHGGARECGNQESLAIVVESGDLLMSEDAEGMPDEAQRCGAPPLPDSASPATSVTGGLCGIHLQ